MEARIESDFASNGHRVWLYHRDRDALRVLRITDRDATLQAPWVTWEAIEWGTDAAPTLLLPEGALEALMKAGGAVVRSSDSTLDALDDARAVRDRLLSLVEQGWTASA